MSDPYPDTVFEEKVSVTSPPPVLRPQRPCVRGVPTGPTPPALQHPVAADTPDNDDDKEEQVKREETGGQNLGLEVDTPTSCLYLTRRPSLTFSLTFFLSAPVTRG